MPAYYQPYQFGNPYQTQPYQQPAPQQPQIQSGGFLSVPSRQDVEKYPVAPGNSVTFFCPKEMMLYVKTKDYSPLTNPVIEDYKITKTQAPVKTENSPSGGVSVPAVNDTEYATKDELDELSERIDALKKNFNSTVSKLEILSDKVKDFTAKKPTTRAKKEGDA